MKYLLALGFLSLTFSTVDVRAETQTSINCNSVIIDLSMPPQDQLLKGYLRLQLEPTPIARMKVTGEVEEVITSDIHVFQLAKQQIVGDEALKVLMEQLGIATNQVESATIYTVVGGGHVEMLTLFFDVNDKELGRGGILDMRALFRCEN